MEITRDFMNALQKIIGQNLRRERIKAGYSQATLAAKLQITFQQIQKYEAGNNRISADKIFILARLFNITPEQFFVNNITPIASYKNKNFHLNEQIFHYLSIIDDYDIQNLFLISVKALAKKFYKKNFPDSTGQETAEIYQSLVE